MTLLLALPAAGCDALVDAGSFAVALSTKEEVGFHIPDVVDSADDLNAFYEMAPDESGSDCGACGGCSLLPPFGLAQRMIFVAVGNGGHPGEGVDVDGNPDTCAPQHDCEAGVNNQLSGLFGVVEKFVNANGELTSAVADGDLNLVLEWRGFKGESVAFNLLVHPATPDLPLENCDWQLESCGFTILEESLDPATCAPLVHFKNAALADGTITAGGPDSIFILRVPLSDSADLKLLLRAARLRGSVIYGAEGPYIVGGVIGGAVRREDMVAAIEQIPDTAYLPVAKETLIALLDLFVLPDIDTDGDDQPDAVSIGVKFEARPATISGFAGDAN